MNQATDEQVLSRVLSGDVAQFELLMRRHNQRLFRVARAVLRDDAEAEDAVQQAWLSAYSHLGQFAGQARFSTWLVRIVLHEALARARKGRRTTPLEEARLDMSEAEPAGRGPEDQAQLRELAHLLERAIDELPEIYRVVVMMRDVQELSTAETADALELTEDAVKVRLHRARAMLRDRLADRVERTAPHAFVFLGERCDRIVSRVLAAIRGEVTAPR